jgi:excisionase family DNA binding protein
MIKPREVDAKDTAPISAAEPLLLTIPEACQRLRIGKTTFYRLRDAGLIRTVQAGGPQTVRVAMADLLACVEHLRQEAGAA